MNEKVSTVALLLCAELIVKTNRSIFLSNPVHMCHGKKKKKGKRNMVEYYRGINAQHGAVYHLSQEEKKERKPTPASHEESLYILSISHVPQQMRWCVVVPAFQDTTAFATDVTYVHS